MALTFNYDFVPPRELEHPLFPIEEVSTKTLVWTQEQPIRPAYELWAGEFVVATLRYRNIARTGGLGAAADGLWIFHESADANGSISILSHSHTIGTLRRSGGLTDTLVLTKKVTYRWVLRDLWRKDRAFVDAKGRIILVCRPEAAQKARTRILLAPGAVQCPDLSLLTVLAQYLMLAHPTNGKMNLANIPGGLTAR